MAALLCLPLEALPLLSSSVFRPPHAHPAPGVRACPTCSWEKPQRSWSSDRQEGPGLSRPPHRGLPGWLPTLSVPKGLGDVCEERKQG